MEFFYEDDTGSVGQLLPLGQDPMTDHCDNVLLEWELALALLEDGHYLMKYIFPVMLGGHGERGFLPFP